MRQKKNEELMAAGVTLIDPATTYIDPDVEIGADTVIHPGVVIEGQTRIGAACEIQAHVRIVDSEIGDQVTINNFCLIVGARVADGASVGPFAHLRPDTAVGEGAKVGNFVELKKTTLGAGLEGESPGLPRRRDDRRQRQRRRRHDHLQLRRRRTSTRRSSRTARSSAATRS